MTYRVDTSVIDELLLQKEAGFFDAFKPPEIPRFLRPDPRLGMGQKKDKKQKLKETQRLEYELWNQWNSRGRKSEDLKPLHDSYKPVINSFARSYAGRVQIPNSAIYREMNEQFVNAVKSYDPSKGTQLNTWVTKQLGKSGRFVKKYQNMGKIPEGQLRLLPYYRRAKDELTSEFGYEPDTKSIAQRMQVPQRNIEQLESELRDDLRESGFMEDPVEVLQPKELEALKLVEYDLTPEERTVYEYTFGTNGRPMLQPGEIAKKAGIHPSKVSRIRNKLKDRVSEMMEYL